MKSTETPFYARLAYVLVSIVILGYLIVLGKEILAPLFFAFLFAILLLPLANFFERKLRFPRTFSTLISIILLITGIYLVIYVLASQLTSLSTEWPALQQNINKAIVNLQKWVHDKFHVAFTKQTAYLNKATADIFSSSASIVGDTVMSISSIVLFNVFTLIYTFFLLMYRRILFRFIVTVFPKENTDIVYDITEQVKYIIGKYVVGLFWEMCIVIALSFGVYTILGVDYALLLALLVGILNLIPYVGIFTALFLSALITFATGEPHQVLYVIIATIVIHLIDSNVIMPKVVGSKVRINPLIIVLGVITGEMMWGISGMFFSIPVIAMMKVIFDRVEGLTAWGILLGDEEYPPKKVLSLKRKVKNLEAEKGKVPEPEDAKLKNL